MSAVAALGELRDERAVPLLLPYLNPSDPLNRRWVVEQTARALGTIGGDSVIEPLAAVVATDPDWDTQYSAVVALGRVNHPRAAAALEEAKRLRANQGIF